MLTADGTFEHYGLIAARAANYHHSRIIQDLDAYNRDDTLRYVVIDRQRPILQIMGEAALDPKGAGRDQISTLCRELIRRGIPRDMPLYIAGPNIEKIGRRLGLIGDYDAP